MFFYKMVANDASLDEMLLDDPLEDRRVALTVPSTFGIHNGDRAAFADSQAVRLRSQNPALVGQAKFLQALLEKVPRDEPAFLLATFGRRLIAAEKDVAPCFRYSDGGSNAFLGLGDQNSLTSTISPLSTISVAAGISK